VKRLLLFGASGQVGHDVASLLGPTHELITPSRAAADLDRPETLRDVVRDARPDIIVNAAAYTAVDQAESDRETARTVNALAPRVLAEEARRLDAQLVHYSTDYVFDGDSAEPYLETDPTGPLNVYGRTKLEGERAIAAAGGRWIILRSGWVYAPRGHNFLLTMRRLFLEREEVRVVSDQTGTPTSSRTLADATRRVIASSAEGLYHVAAAGHTTWHGFASRILQRDRRPGRRCRAVVPITTAEYPAAAKRPRFSVLDTTRFEKDFGLSPVPWQDQLDALLTEL
jgi:dTDP-4-dehydrorhamnose reductase